MPGTLLVNKIGAATGTEISFETGHSMAFTTAQFKLTGGTAGQAITTDGSGNLTFADMTSDPTMGGDLTGTASNAQIVAGAVGTTEIATDAVTANEIVAGAIGSSEIATDAVTANELADNAVDTNAIIDSAVTSAKIADGTIVNADVNASAAIAQSKLSNVPYYTISTTEPSSPTTGDLWFDTNVSLKVLKSYNGTAWVKVSAITPLLFSASGTIYVGIATTLTLTGSGFLSSNLVVNFTQSSDSIDEDITVTPASDTSASVTLTSAIYSNVTAGNDVTIQVTNSDLVSSGAITKTSVAPPSGGTVTTSGNYRIHTFTSSGTFANTISNLSVEYLVIAGGGGGGKDNNPGGGGGAGGYRSSVVGESSGGGASAESSSTLSASDYTVTIGAGGSPDNDGSPSVFNTITSVGGGSGSPLGNTPGNSGGSGGGASYASTGGAGTSGQGYAGGDTGGYASGTYATGGGGGANAIGVSGNLSSGASGDGGNGVSSSITGSAVTRAGGGGGSMYSTGTAGSGGAGGGGNGGSSSSGATNASVNTGSGGGGYSVTNTGGFGGSGIVVIRYQM